MSYNLTPYVIPVEGGFDGEGMEGGMGLDPEDLL